MKKVILIVALLLFLPSKVNGYCSYEEKVRLNNIAKNIDITYDYYYEGNRVKFNMTITNMHKDVYIYDTHQMATYYYNGNLENPKEVTYNDYYSGSTCSFLIYGNTPNCKGELIMTQYKTLPAYNGYSADPLCVGIEEFELCQKWKTAPIDYEAFVEAVTEYRNKEVIEEEKEIKIEKNLDYYINLAIDLLAKYYMYYVLAMVLVGLLVLVLRQNDNFKIE